MGKLTIWEKFLMRLQSIANNEFGGGCDGVAFIEIEAFVAQGTLIGWPKPQRIPLEPKLFDCSALNLLPARTWSGVLRDLQREVNGHAGKLQKTLVVKNSEPVGWLQAD